MTKKVGIITLHYAYNYGSVLQAYALQKVINDWGYNANIINYVDRHDFINYQLFRWQHYLTRPREIAADIVFLRKNFRRKQAFRHFQEKYLHILGRPVYKDEDMRELGNAFDYYITGSDQVWNFKVTGGVNPIYFLNFVNHNASKIAYAPSMGELDQTQTDLQAIEPLLRKFDHMSIREKSTKKRIEALYGRPVQVTVDPTLLLDSKNYASLTEKILQPTPKGKYIFVYLLEPNNTLVDYVQKLAAEQGLLVIYISNIVKGNVFGNVTSNSEYGASPERFLQLIKNATFVVTNSFHATIFSILFERQFVTFKTKKSFPRMLDLLQTIGLEDRVSGDTKTISNQIDYSHVEEKLNIVRASSLEYLRSALDLEHAL